MEKDWCKFFQYLNNLNKSRRIAFILVNFIYVSTTVQDAKSTGAMFYAGRGSQEGQDCQSCCPGPSGRW